MLGPCRQATARLGLGFGLTLRLRVRACSSGGWMQAEQAMPGPCRQAAARLGFRLGLTLRLRVHTCSLWGWMRAEQAMPGPCRQATARPGLGFGLTRPQNACVQLRGGGCRPSSPCQDHAGRLQLGLALRLASHEASECMRAAQGGGMQAKQAMPGPCRQATARLGIALGLT